MWKPAGWKLGTAWYGPTPLRLARYQGISSTCSLFYDHGITLSLALSSLRPTQTQDHGYTHSNVDPPAPTMYLISLFVFLATISHTASALPKSDQSLLDFVSLPKCAQNCTVLVKAITDCLAPMAPGGVMDHATYISCFCRNHWLWNPKDYQNTCASSCDQDKATIEQYYGKFCNVPSPYIALPSTPTPTAPPVAPPTDKSLHTSSGTASAPTSTLDVVHTQSSSSMVEGSQKNHEASESW